MNETVDNLSIRVSWSYSCRWGSPEIAAFTWLYS